MLAKYPPHVIKAVTDPLSGIPTKCSFLPTLAELRAALELEMKPIYDELRERRRQQELLKEKSFAPTQEERERVGKMMRELSAKLSLA